MNARWTCPLVLLFAASVSGEPVFQSPVTLEVLDAGAFAEWGDGAEKAIRPEDPKDKSHTPQGLIATEKMLPTHSGLKFGDSKQPGPRHLRIGFKKALPVGAVLVRGGGKLSVLRTDAAYPGNLADDSQWLPAQRVVQGNVSVEEVDDKSYGLWTLPANKRVSFLSMRIS